MKFQIVFRWNKKPRKTRHSLHSLTATICLFLLFFTLITRTSTSFVFTLSHSVLLTVYMAKKIESKLGSRYIRFLFCVRSCLHISLWGRWNTHQPTHTHFLITKTNSSYVFFFSSIFPNTANWLTIGKKRWNANFSWCDMPTVVGINNVLYIYPGFHVALRFFHMSNETCSHIGISWLNLSIFPVFILSFIASNTTQQQKKVEKKARLVLLLFLSLHRPSMNITCLREKHDDRITRIHFV